MMVNLLAKFSSFTETSESSPTENVIIIVISYKSSHFCWQKASNYLEADFLHFKLLNITITRASSERKRLKQTIYFKTTHTDAHNSMAQDSVPLILTGFKLQRKTPNRPSNWSLGTKLASPLTTVRGFSSPTSTVST